MTFAGALLASLGSPPCPAEAPPKPLATRTVSCAEGASIPAPVGRVVNNMWNARSAGAGPWRQCIVTRPAAGGLGTEVGWHWSWPDRDGLYAYPEVVIGRSPWSPAASNDPRFPRRIADTGRLRLDFDLAVASEGRQNLATEFWITSRMPPAGAVDPGIVEAELMIWTQASPGLVDPARPPAGEVSIDGILWTVHVRPGWGDASGGVAHRWTLVSYHPRGDLQKVAIDAAAFLRDAVARGFVSPSGYVCGVEIGNEIVSGRGATWIRRLVVDVMTGRS